MKVGDISSMLFDKHLNESKIGFGYFFPDSCGVETVFGLMVQQN